MKPVVIVTRSQPKALDTAARLAAMGYAPVRMPMLQTAYDVAAPPDGLQDFDGCIATSMHALRAVDDRPDIQDFKRHKPLFTVGPATATLARQSGWLDVREGGGDAALLAAMLPPQRLVHLAGEQLAEGTQESFAGSAAEIAAWHVYTASPAGFEAAVFDEAVRGDAPFAVLLYSPRAAALFSEGVRTYAKGLENRRMNLLCLSQEVLKFTAAAPCGAAYAAGRPDEDSLLDLLRRTLPVP